MKTSSDNYYKCEYENLRRRKNKEIEKLQVKASNFVRITYSLLKNVFKLTDEEINNYYKLANKMIEEEKEDGYIV